MLDEKDFKKTFKFCLSKIRGTVWDNVVFPKPKTENQFKTEKLFEREIKKLEAKIPNYEFFFNEIEPNIDYEKSTKTDLVLKSGVNKEELVERIKNLQ